MKKILSMLLACMCLCTNLVTATNEPSQSTNVELDVPIEYTWTTPASLDLIESTPVSGTIEVSKNVIPEDTKLVISLANDNSFTVISDEGAERTYSITKGGTAVNAGDEVLSVVAGTDSASQDLGFSVEGIASGKKAGTFKGTANFTASIVELISFTIGGTLYHAEEGMTFGEWINSDYSLSLPRQKTFTCETHGEFVGNLTTLNLGDFSPYSYVSNKFDRADLRTSDMNIVSDSYVINDNDIITLKLICVD